MERRKLIMLACTIIPSAMLGGCDSDPKPSHTATLTNNSAVDSAMSTLDDMVGDLEQDSEAFGDGSNWQEVVDDLQDHVEQLRGTLDDLRTALQYKG